MSPVILAACDEWKVTAPDFKAYDEFGAGVGVYKDVAVIGSPKNDEIADNAGAAYVYVKSGEEWNLKEKLTAFDAEADDFYGDAVATNGEYIFVGAWGDDGGMGSIFSGAVYVYVLESGDWKLKQKIPPSNTVYGGKFGQALAVCGNYLVVGAPYENYSNFSNAGAVYLFHNDGSGEWSLLNKFFAPDPDTFAQFGRSVDIDKSHITGGAPHKYNTAALCSGSAYIFSYCKNGSVVHEASAYGLDHNERFGWDVSVDNFTWAIGAFNRNFGVNQRGIVQVRSFFSGWNIQSVLTGPVNNPRTFGWSVEVKENRIYVGDYWGDGKENFSGLVFAYEYNNNTNTWDLRIKVMASDGNNGDKYAKSIATDGETLLMGAYWDSDLLTKSGSAYFYWIP